MLLFFTYLGYYPTFLPQRLGPLLMSITKYSPKLVLNRHHIDDFPFEEFADLELSALDDLATQYKLSSFNSWMLPQLLAHFGSWKPYWNDEGLIDPKLTVIKNVGSSKKSKGMWMVCCRLMRSTLVAKQSALPGTYYGALVPLILAGFKKYQNIPYSKWSREGIQFVVDKNLAEAMCTTLPELDVARILEIREDGLTIKTGEKRGQKKSATSTWALTGIQDTELSQYPRLAVTMLTQIWMAHPSLRNEYMILDPNNWDRMPEPLVGIEIFELPKLRRVSPIEGQSFDPWELV